MNTTDEIISIIHRSSGYKRLYMEAVICTMVGAVMPCTASRGDMKRAIRLGRILQHNAEIQADRDNYQIVENTITFIRREWLLKGNCSIKSSSPKEEA